MSNAMTSLLSRLVSTLVRCPVCRASGSSLQGCCEQCLPTLFSPAVHDDELVLGAYQGSLERAIRALKFGRATRLSVLFGRTIAELVRQSRWQVDVVCPVPLHPVRQLTRGFNQSALIARQVARHLDLPCRNLLRRSRKTRQQARLTLKERQVNVAGAFRAKGVRGAEVLLVDDVITSGATTVECRLALFAAGASRVQLAAVARAVQDLRSDGEPPPTSGNPSLKRMRPPR